MIRFLLIFAVSLLMALGPVKHALAHPHEFVTMRITAQFDENGHVRGLLYNWTFDPFFTAYAVEGEDANKNGKAEQEELDALLKNILGNIESVNYFTAFDANGVVPEFAKGIPIASELQDQQLVVTFDLPFKKPVDPKKKTLRYAVYDDEFYIAMTHDPEADAVQLVNAPKGCKFDMQEPAPTDDMTEFAASLGRNESAGGRHRYPFCRVGGHFMQLTAGRLIVFAAIGLPLLAGLWLFATGPGVELYHAFLTWVFTEQRAFQGSMTQACRSLRKAGGRERGCRHRGWQLFLRRFPRGRARAR